MYLSPSLPSGTGLCFGDGSHIIYVNNKCRDETPLGILMHDFVYFVCSAERDNLLKGYGCKYALYILQKGDLCVVAYSPVLEDFVNTLKHSDPDGILAAIEGKYRLKKMRLLVFQEEKVTEYGNTKVLEGKDYPLFESFSGKRTKTLILTVGCRSIFRKRTAV